MIIVNVRSTTARYDGQTVDEMMESPRSLFEKVGVDYSRAVTSLSGEILTDQQMDQPFAELGVSGMCTLSAIVKASGAMF